jgi:hypothetical protein
MTGTLHVAEGSGNTVHRAMRNSDDVVIGTYCNGEPFTTGHRRRTFTRITAPLTCQRCAKFPA